MRNGVFPAISVNKDVTAISCSHPPNVNSWAQRAPRKSSACYLAAISHSPQWALRSWRGGWGWGEVWKMRILAPDRWDAYKRNDFNEPRLLHLPIHRKVLNSLTWDIWFSLINNNLLMFRVPALSCKLLYNLTPPCSAFRVTWDAVSWASSPKIFHQIKTKLSQLLGCDCFFFKLTQVWFNRIPFWFLIFIEYLIQL